MTPVPERSRENAALVGAAAAAVARCIDDIRLPLHILLESRFGDLNENQEEMLASAYAAAERAHEELRRLMDIAELDRGAVTLRSDQLRLADLILSLRPTLESVGARAGVHVMFDLAPALPFITGDRARLQEALSLLLTEAVRGTPAERTVRIAAERDGDMLRLRVEHAAPPSHGTEVALARRLIEAQGGVLETSGGTMVITVPLAGAGKTEKRTGNGE